MQQRLQVRTNQGVSMGMRMVSKGRCLQVIINCWEGGTHIAQIKVVAVRTCAHFHFALLSERWFGCTTCCTGVQKPPPAVARGTFSRSAACQLQVIALILHVHARLP